MPISQYGTLNTAAIVVPDVYVQIVPPAIAAINGSSTDVLGLVGTASWGPVNQPTVLGNPSQYNQSFGPVVARKYDMGTHVATAALQGASDFICVRQTDSTDTAATVAIGAPELANAPAFYAALALAINVGVGVNNGPSKLVTFNATSGGVTAAYTGSLGSTVSLTISAGSKVSTFRAVVSMAGRQSEIFDNLAAVSGHVPTAATYALVGGTDGAGVTAAQLVGTDVSPRTGMYALRAQACSVALLADCDDSTTYTTQGAFGLSECVYMVLTGPSGDTIANAVAVKASVGLDNYAAKIMFGDWLYWFDSTAALTRVVSPQGFAAGKLVALAPNAMAGNKPMSGIVASQRSGSGAGTYSSAELTQLITAGYDVITNPIVRGSSWGCRVGHNSSSDSSRYTDNYTRMTFMLAETLDLVAGQYQDEPISLTLLQSATSSFLDTLSNIAGQGLLSFGYGTLPYSVVCNESNNSQARTGIGYLQADISVRLQGIAEKFIVNLQDGAGVVIGSAASQS
jgi:hypothetical protein